MSEDFVRLLSILKNAFWQMLEKGFEVTVPLTILAFAVAFVISVVVALSQYADVKGLKGLCRFYIWIIRGTPLLVQLWLVFYGLPKVGLLFPAFPTAVFVFGLNEGAYMAESMRAALEAVPKGQLEAGYCVGMTYTQVMRRIVLPQALRTAFPPLSNSFISLVKGTSLAATITVTEMFRQAQVINARYYEPLWLYVEVALIYLFFCTLLTWLQGKIEKRLNAYGGTR